MDEAVSHLLSTGAMMMGLVSFIGTFILRRVVETAVPSAKKKADANENGISYETVFARWWNEVFLYVLPAAVGGSVGFANIPYIFAGMGIETWGGRVTFGIVMGFFSGFFYKVVRKALKAATGVDITPTRGGSVASPQPPAS